MTTDTVQVPSHVEITVRRPGGNVETVRMPGRTMVSAREIEQIKLQTAKAGRGEVLSVVNVTKAVAAPQPSAADLERDAYERNRAAVYRASAGGEPYDDGRDHDNTPAHPSDL